MSKLDEEPLVRQMAHDLGLDWRKRPVQQVVDYCLCKVEGWFPEGKPPESVRELQELVRGKVNLKFEEVHDDAELDAVIRKYVTKGDPVFANLRNTLDNWTFAELIERKNAVGEPDRYVAVIDCRGPGKAARAFFTRWHEIAHVLTLTPRLQPPFNRGNTSDRCPVERLMDVVGGTLAFYGPIFRPMLASTLVERGGLSFEAISQLRDRYDPSASFYSTAIAAVKAYERPAILISAELSLKKRERYELDANQTYLFSEAQPEPILRAVSVTPNAAARSQGLRIDRNMAVPPGSVIALAFSQGPEAEVQGHENLSAWRHSDGSTLPPAEVIIEARAAADQVLALIQTDHNTDATLQAAYLNSQIRRVRG